MEHIVFLDRASIPADVRRPDIDHDWREFEQTSRDEVAQRLGGATIAISNKVPLRADALAGNPALRMIAAAATGTDHIDLDYCRQHAIAVANVRGYAAHSVPEHVFALALALRRNLFAYRAAVRSGEWQKSTQFCLLNHAIGDLHGSTLGIVGFGTLGAAVKRLAECFGMRVLVAERKNGVVIRDGMTPFDEVLRQSDVITLHTPLTEETRHLIGAAEFGLMRPQAILINTARGGLVDEQALADALKDGRIAGAGFDVLSSEPPSGGNLLLDLDLPNFILTPHVAWGSSGAIRNLADQVTANIEAFVGGRELNRVV